MTDTTPVDGLDYPYRVFLSGRAYGFQRRIVNTRTFVGAVWIIGQFRSEGNYAYMEQYDPNLKGYRYIQTIQYTRYE